VHCAVLYCTNHQTEDNWFGMHVARIRKKELPGDLLGKSMEKSQPGRLRRKGKNFRCLNVVADVDKLCAFVSTGMNSRLRTMRDFTEQDEGTRIFARTVNCFVLTRKKGEAL